MRIFPISITLLTCLLFSTIHADNNLHIQKRGLANQDVAGASSITFNLYETRTDAVPLMSQTFEPGEWLKKSQTGHTIVSAELSNTAFLQDTSGLWVELEIKGQAVGQREPLAAGATGITFATGNPLNMSGNAIRDVADPTLDQDAATKAYVDDVVTATGSGDISAVMPGFGLSGGGQSGDVTLRADSSVLQKRIIDHCAPGFAINAVDVDGAVSCITTADTNDTNAGTICPPGTYLNGDGNCHAGFLDVDGTDADTTYTASASTGLWLSGTTFSINRAMVARKDASAGNQAFDTSTLYLDYANNRVGINDSNPLETLDINGTVQASKYIYRNQRAYSRYISAIEFSYPPYRTYDGSERFEYRYHVGSITPYAYGTHSHLVSGIQLPQGANMSRLTCYYIDNSTLEDIQSLDANLTSRSFLASNITTLGSIHATTTGNNPDIIQNVDISVFGEGDPIDNRHVMYLLNVEMRLTENTSGENFFRYSGIEFYGCKIDYLLGEVAP